MRIGAIVRLCLCAIGFMVFVPCAPSPAAEPAASQVPSDWQSLHDRWAAVLRDLKVPGMAVAVVKDDKIVLLDALGVRDPEGTLPVAVDSPFYIASSTKSFTAMAVAILVDEGKIDLDAPVKKYLPRFALKDPRATDEMTVRDLLAHRRGIDSALIATGEAYSGLMTEDRYYRLLARVKPTNKFQYSNLNFTLAGRVIEAASGKNWKEFVAERILAPAGMRHSYCLASQLYADPLAAQPIEEVRGQWQKAHIVKIDATMHAAGGMGASAADLAQWLRLNLAGGTIDGRRILSEKLVREMQSPQVEAGREENGPLGFGAEHYGLGWLLGKYEGRRSVFHFGGYDGARCHVSFLPDDRVGVAVTVNEAGPAFATCELVASDCYAKLLDLKRVDPLPEFAKNVARIRGRMEVRAPTAGDPPGAGQGLSLPATAYAGDYFHEDYGTARIEVTGDRLAGTLGAFRARLVSTGVDQFTGALVPGPEMKGRFEIDPGGRVVAIVLAGTFQEQRFVKQ